MSTRINLHNFFLSALTCFLFCFFGSFNISGQNGFSNIFPEIIKESDFASNFFIHEYEGHIYSFGVTQALSYDSSIYTEMMISKLDYTGKILSTSYLDLSDRQEQNIFYSNFEVYGHDSLIFIPSHQIYLSDTGGENRVGIVRYNIEKDSFSFHQVDFGSNKYEFLGSNIAIDSVKRQVMVYGYYEIDSVNRNDLENSYYITFLAKYNYDGNLIRRIDIDSVENPPSQDISVFTNEIGMIHDNLFALVRSITFQGRGEILLVDSNGFKVNRIKFSDSIDDHGLLDNMEFIALEDRFLVFNGQIEHTYMNYPIVYYLRVSEFDFSGNLIRSKVIDSNLVAAHESLPIDVWMDDGLIYVLNLNLTTITNEVQFPFLEILDPASLERLDSRNLKHDFKDTVDQRLFSGVVTQDNGIWLCGGVSFEDDYSYPWIMKLDSNYCLREDSCGATLVSIESDKLNDQLRELEVFPNPFSDEITIQYVDIHRLKSIEILNTHGKSVLFTSQIKETLKLNHLKSGVYFVVLTMNDNSFTYRKIIKQ